MRDTGAINKREECESHQTEPEACVIVRGESECESERRNVTSW